MTAREFAKKNGIEIVGNKKEGYTIITADGDII